MTDDDQHTVGTARHAGERGDLARWVAEFLASPGSDNPLLGEMLTKTLGWWVGPQRLPIDDLHRLAGPRGDPVLCPVDDDYWDGRVGEIEEMARNGREPPPVIVSHRDGELVLEDGNHRVEALRRAGRRRIWAVIGFETAEDRDRFLSGSQSD